MVPYDKERTITRNEKTVTRDTRLPTIRDDEQAATRTKLSASSSSRNRSAPSKRSELERRLGCLEDEKTRRLERQVEKLGDQVVQLQLEKGKQRHVDMYAAPVVYASSGSLLQLPPLFIGIHLYVLLGTPLFVLRMGNPY